MLRHHFVSEMFTEHLAFSPFTAMPAIAGRTIDSGSLKAFLQARARSADFRFRKASADTPLGLPVLSPSPACAADFEEQ